MSASEVVLFRLIWFLWLSSSCHSSALELNRNVKNAIIVTLIGPFCPNADCLAELELNLKTFIYEVQVYARVSINFAPVIAIIQGSNGVAQNCPPRSRPKIHLQADRVPFVVVLYHDSGWSKLWVDFYFQRNCTFMWRFLISLRLKVTPQTIQANGCSPVWRNMCTRKWSDRRKG